VPLGAAWFPLIPKNGNRENKQLQRGHGRWVANRRSQHSILSSGTLVHGKLASPRALPAAIESLPIVALQPKNCGDNLGASGGLVQCFLAIASEQAKSVRAWRFRCYFMQKRQRVAILGVDRPLLTGFREIKARQPIE
jgi:hypothetical protein